MNERNIPDTELEKILKQAFEDDLPPEAETGMNRHFIDLKRGIEAESTAGREKRRKRFRWLWTEAFGKEVLAIASAFMLILGGIMHLSGNQSALANSITRLKTVIDLSAGLNSATSMDCTVIQPGTDTSYRIRWSSRGITRVDMDSGGFPERTLWISNTTVPPDPVWNPAMEFLAPVMLAQHIENRYGFNQAGPEAGSGIQDLLLAGNGYEQPVEITIDQVTFLPKTLKKYLTDHTGKRRCVLEARFLWNQPVPYELFIPGGNNH